MITTITVNDGSGTTTLYPSIAQTLLDYATLTGSQTLTNKTLTSPKINENVALSVTSTKLNYSSTLTSNIQDQLNSKAPLASPTFSGTAYVAGNSAQGNMTITAETIELASGRNADGYSFIDFHSDTTNTDYSARIIRNPGVNGILGLENNGTGGIILSPGSGYVGIGTSTPQVSLDIQGADNSQARVKATTNGVDLRMSALGLTSNAGIVGTYSNNPLVLYTNSTERMRIDASGRFTLPYQPSFFVRGTGSQSWTGTTVYTKLSISGFVHVNIGSHYSTANSRFTAPVAGTYLFHAISCVTTSIGGPEMHIYVNGVNTVSTFAIGYGAAYNTFGGEAILTLNANDYVEIYISNNNSTAFTIDLSRTSFSGRLLG